GRTSFSGYPDGPYMLPHQNPPPSGTRSGPGSYIAGTGYNRGGYASAAAATPEYHVQNNDGPSVNRRPPAQGGFADCGNCAPSSGYPHKVTCHRLVREVLMLGCYVDGKKGRSSGGMTSPHGPLHSFPLPVSLSLPLF
nr:hypothetical protein [Tanacetum cinerariifolium]